MKNAPKNVNEPSTPTTPFDRRAVAYIAVICGGSLFLGVGVKVILLATGVTNAAPGQSIPSWPVGIFSSIAAVVILAFGCTRLYRYWKYEADAKKVKR